MHLFLSNIRTAIRNLWKYKLQNTISILCLAAGILCFAVTYHYVTGMWNQSIYQPSKTHWCHFTEKETMNSKRIGKSEFQRLLDSKPSSIDQLLFKQYVHFDPNRDPLRSPEPEDTWILTDHKGKEWTMHDKVFVVSPDYLACHGYRSAVTGNPLPTLKPGTILMTDGLWRLTMDKKINPAGWNARCNLGDQKTHAGSIYDIVRSTIGETLHGMFIVNDTPFLCERDSVQDIQVKLSKGKTSDDLQSELQRLYPDYRIFVSKPHESRSTGVMLILAIFMLLGSSVLVIGILEFLKTETQLFRQRSHEMALRRLMGAHPWQLFALLAYEIILVFGITALVCKAVTVLTASYALPIIYAVTSNYLDMDTIYHLEGWTILFTLSATLLLAALSVRHTLHAPVGTIAGRRRRTSHTGRSIVLVTQYVFCTLFLFAVFVTYQIIRHETHGAQLPDSTASLKRCMVIDQTVVTDLHDSEISSLPSAELCGGLFAANFFLSLDIDTTLYVNRTTLMGEDTPVGYFASVALCDEAYFQALGIRPVAARDNMDRHSMLPVYVTPEDAEATALSLKVEQGPRRSATLINGKSYTCIGHAPMWKSAFSFGRPSYYIVVPKADLGHPEAILPTWNNITAHYLFPYPKPHYYERLKDELDNLYHEKHTGDLMPLKASGVYETWFAMLRYYDLVSKLCLLLALINLLGIVFSLYSTVSLDTRRRQKEVALRKIHGAKTHAVVCLFGHYYLLLLLVTAVISIPFAFLPGVFGILKGNHPYEDLATHVAYMAASLLVVAAVTLLTVAGKIYKASLSNPADIIKKE